MKKFNARTHTIPELAKLSNVSVSTVERCVNCLKWNDNRRKTFGKKLTLERVESIRNDVGTQRAIAKKHGVSQSMVSLIRRGLVWNKQGIDNAERRRVPN